jgi:hypothetical protein
LCNNYCWGVVLFVAASTILDLVSRRGKRSASIASVYPTVPLPQKRTKFASKEDGKRRPAYVEIYATGTKIYVVKTNSFLIIIYCRKLNNNCLPCVLIV